jgi:hypothetical protein
MRPILSEQQAEAIGKDRTGGERDKDFKVFAFTDRRSNLTFFAVRIIDTKELISMA